jgi:hypothetical protein
MEMSKKLEDAYIQRMSPELKAKFTALSADERAAILKAMIRFHQVIEEETFQLVLGMINAKTEKMPKT